jgi:STE24 endopeptidase
MYDLLFVTALILPLIAPYLAGQWVCQGFASLTPEARAQRSYRLSWFISFCMLAQFGLPIWIASQWGDSMRLAGLFPALIESGINFSREHLSPGFAVAFTVTITMLILAVNCLVICVPHFRVMRLAKGLSGGTGRESKIFLRSILGSQFPMLVWILLINAAPPELLLNPVAFSMSLIVFIAAQFVFAPFLVQLANPTAPLMNPQVEAMCKALCEKAGVRFGGVRLWKFGEAKVANALVCGLLPWYRRIYISDRMLEVFSLDEVRAVLAHEIGHMKKCHLWWYLAFAVVGSQIAGPVVSWMTDCGVNDFFAIFGYWGLFWGVMFPFWSRRFERQADRYALELTGDKEVLVVALEKLATVNGATRKWSKWDIFQSHPDIAARVQGL